MKINRLKEIIKDMPDDLEIFIRNTNYICEEDGTRVEWYIDDEWLNMNAEIIEEDKKIEKLDVDKIYERKYLCDDISIDFLKADIMGISNKINEIIDYIMEDK